jgi:GTPase SAR1 family protein
VPSLKPLLTAALFLLSLTPLIAGAEEKKPSIPSWHTLAKDEIYEIQVIFLPDSKVEQKITRQISLNDKDCEQNGNRSLEKEDANSFITVECHADGNLLIRRSTLQPLGKLKQDLSFSPVGTSRFEVLQGSDYYPDILIKVSRLKTVKPTATPRVTPGAKPK